MTDVQTEKIRDGAVAFRQLGWHIHRLYCEGNGIALDG